MSKNHFPRTESMYIVLLYVIWVLGFRNNNNDLFVVYWLLVFVIEIPLYFLCPELQSLFWIMHPTTYLGALSKRVLEIVFLILFSSTTFSKINLIEGKK